MSLYVTLQKRGYPDKDASHIATQMANRYGEKFIELDPVLVMHELDDDLMCELREEGRKVYWFEVNEEKYFDGNIRTPYCILMYELAN